MPVVHGNNNLSVRGGNGTGIARTHLREMHAGLDWTGQKWEKCANGQFGTESDCFDGTNVDGMMCMEWDVSCGGQRRTYLDSGCTVNDPSYPWGHPYYCLRNYGAASSWDQGSYPYCPL